MYAWYQNTVEYSIVVDDSLQEKRNRYVPEKVGLQKIQENGIHLSVIGVTDLNSTDKSVDVCFDALIIAYI